MAPMIRGLKLLQAPKQAQLHAILRGSRPLTQREGPVLCRKRGTAREENSNKNTKKLKKRLVEYHQNNNIYLEVV